MNDTPKNNEASTWPSASKAQLDCETPRKPLRVTQHKDEPPDLFAIRAWVEAMRFMDSNAMMAAANWISARTQAELDSIRKQSNAARQRR